MEHHPTQAGASGESYETPAEEHVEVPTAPPPAYQELQHEPVHQAQQPANYNQPQHDYQHGPSQSYGAQQPANYNQPQQYPHKGEPVAGSVQPQQLGVNPYPQNVSPQYLQATGSHVVVQQPGHSVVYVNQAPPTSSPERHLVIGIFNFLCCCPLFGIIAVIFAAMAMAAYGNRDYATSDSYSRIANGFNIAGIVIALVCYTVIIIVVREG